MMTRKPPFVRRARSMLGHVGVVWVLSACTSVPHVPQHHFNDAWGDRGEQIFARDAAWCAEAVESRRSHWSVCMRGRGWQSGP
jgi:hypothetical protein